MPKEETILVVEDEALIREVAVVVLEDARYRTLEARDGRAALDILSGSEPIDVVFTDVVMPGGVNGVQVARQARELRPGIKVLMTSGYSDAFLRDQGLDGSVDLLAKPYRPADLLRRIGSLLHPG